MLEVAPGGRDRRLVGIILVLGATALFFVVVGQLANVFAVFGDILLTFFLAWLLAFVISPVVARISGVIPRLPRVVATVLVYTILVAALVAVLVVVAGALANSIGEFIASLPRIRADLPTILRPWQDRLAAIGFGQVDLTAQALAVLDNLDEIAAALTQPLQQIAVASISVIGTMLIVFFLSIYMVLDHDQILAFLFRVVPPAYADEARLLQTSVSRAFGGFLRGQAVMGVTFFAMTLAISLAFGVPFVVLTSVTAGLLMAIPFFGPFLAWAPPVAAALLLQTDAVLPTLIATIAAWMIVMNVLQPRIMLHSVGIHPLVVLGSVLVGSRIAGIPGAIFGIPVAAVVSAFFFFYLRRSSADRSVTGRAARRVSEREGRTIRVPREPEPGSEPDVEDGGEEDR